MYMIAEVSQYVAVASFTEAWIEIVSVFSDVSTASSPPSRRRGLKSSLSYCLVIAIPSPPSRRRGLKSRSCACKTGQTMSPPSRRRGLKWTSRKHIFSIRCRLLHGGVDWNSNTKQRYTQGSDVASFTEAWIEIHDPLKIQRYSRVASFTEAWIEIRINANLR